MRLFGIVTIAVCSLAFTATLSVAEWSRELVVQGAAKPSLEVGPDGVLRIAFMLEAMPGFVGFAEKREGQWATEQISTGYFYGPLDLVLSGTDPIINYHDHDLEDQVVAIRGAEGWTFSPISHPGHDGWDNTVGIDPAGTLHTLTTDPMDFGGPGLEYASLIDGAWRVEEVGTGPIMYAEGLSMIFAADGTPHISYHNTLERSLYHGVRREEGWELTRVDSGPDAGMFSSVALVDDGRPLISYVKFAASGAEIRLASFEGGAWQSELIDTVPDLTVGFLFARNATSLVLDPEGVPHVAFTGESAIEFARKAGDSWEIELIDDIANHAAPRFGEQVDLERDASGGWHLTSFVVTNPSPLAGDILYYRRDP